MSIRDAILDAAVQSLAQGGEASLRVHDIARAVGCSVSALYVHFGSREGLAEAALIERFRRVTSEVNESFTEQLLRAKSATAVKRAITIHVSELCAPEHAPVHLARAELVAAARTRPAVQAALSEAEQQRHAALRDALAQARDKGLVRRDLDLDAVAALLRSHSLSQALLMSDGNGHGHTWPKVLSRSIEGLLAP
jgi:AcrR family transcriptional regulator